MRERTTWQNKEAVTTRQAATSRRADIYDMNVERPNQPTADQYMPANAGPDMWAETPANYDNSLIKADYDAKGHVKRNEVGYADFQAPTFDRPAWGSGKYDNHKFASSERKAMASHRLASNLLRTSDRALIRKIAVGFMALPDAALSNALKAVQDISPAALSDEARFKRAYACTKLAARMLGESADEPTVERLARSIFQIDDPTLKSMIKIVAASKEASEGSGSEASASASVEPKKAAAKKEEESKSDKAPPKAAAKKAEHPESSTSASASWSAEKSESSKSGGSDHPIVGEEMSESSSSGSGSEDALMKMMMPPAPPMGEGMAPAPMAPMGDMAPVAPAPMAPTAGKMATDISFDDDTAPMTVHTSALEALFADDPEVKAQREIAAAQREQVTRAAGYNVERTASTKGAKKLGSVKAAKETSAEASLAAIWDRP